MITPETDEPELPTILLELPIRLTLTGETDSPTCASGAGRPPPALWD